MRQSSSRLVSEYQIHLPDLLRHLILRHPPLARPAQFLLCIVCNILVSSSSFSSAPSSPSTYSLSWCSGLKICSCTQMASLCARDFPATRQFELICAFVDFITLNSLFAWPLTSGQLAGLLTRRKLARLRLESWIVNNMQFPQTHTRARLGTRQ